MGIDFTSASTDNIQRGATANPEDNEALSVIDKSWEGRKRDDKGVDRGATFGVTVDTSEVGTTVSTLRKAAAHRGLGLSVQVRDVVNKQGVKVEGKQRVAFATKTKRSNNK